MHFSLVGSGVVKDHRAAVAQREDFHLVSPPLLLRTTAEQPSSHFCLSGIYRKKIKMVRRLTKKVSENEQCCYGIIGK
jgi:hypothetical protein